MRKIYPNFSLFYSCLRGTPGITALVVVLCMLSTSISAQNETSARVSKKMNAGYYLTTAKMLNFTFKEPYTSESGNLSYIIYKRPSDVLVSGALSKVRGANFFSLYVDLSPGKYILEVRDEKQEKYYLRFQI